MKVGVLGSGAREHALYWKIAMSVGESNVVAMPGNGGTANRAAVDPMDFSAVRGYCRDAGVRLLVVGPERPLAAGIVDALRDTGIAVFGPGRDAARLEGSKEFAKGFMKRHGVATADSEAFSHLDEALPYVRRLHGNVAVKYDGLAGGKGVIVCGGEKEAVAAIERIGAMFGRESRFVVEERLVGQEVSVLGLTDGKDIRLFQPVRDHKRLRDGDEGPNTGGMGAYGPAPDVDKEVARRIVKEVVAPTLAGIQAEKLDYRGCIYFGLMLTAEGPKLLEYNVRFGDPETQVLMPLLSSDLVDLLAACCEARLGSGSLHFHDMSCVAVVLAAAGYPDQVEVGQEVSGLARTEPGLPVFHAGTKLLADGRVVTAGGRVVSVVGAGGDVGEAAEAAYRAVKRIRFAGMQYRADIGRAGQGER